MRKDTPKKRPHQKGAVLNHGVLICAERCVIRALKHNGGTLYAANVREGAAIILRSSGGKAKQLGRTMPEKSSAVRHALARLVEDGRVRADKFGFYLC